jgi:transcriptional regulator with XRE-family HTH domain
VLFTDAEARMARTPDPMDLEAGARLRLLRRRAGISQQALGAALGVSFQQVQKYESGANRLSVARLRRAAVALGVTAADLVGEGAAAGSAVDWSLLRTAGAEAVLIAYGRIGSARRRRIVLELARVLAEGG